MMIHPCDAFLVCYSEKLYLFSLVDFVPLDVVCVFPHTEIERGYTFVGLIFTTEHKTGQTGVLLLLKRGKPTILRVRIRLSTLRMFSLGHRLRK